MNKKVNFSLILILSHSWNRFQIFSWIPLQLAVQKGILLDIRLPGLIELYPKLNDGSEGSADSSQSNYSLLFKLFHFLLNLLLNSCF